MLFLARVCETGCACMLLLLLQGFLLLFLSTPCWPDMKRPTGVRTICCTIVCFARSWCCREKQTSLTVLSAAVGGIADALFCRKHCASGVDSVWSVSIVLRHICGCQSFRSGRIQRYRAVFGLRTLYLVYFYAVRVYGSRNITNLFCSVFRFQWSRLSLW